MEKWEWIKAFFSNDWVVDIGTAIISGLILFFLTNKFVSTKAEKEVKSNVKRVNEEIVFFLEKLLSEDITINKTLIEIAKDSFSRKNGVPLTLINTNDQIFNDLITEVYQTGFISKDRKARIVNELIMNEDLRQDSNGYKIENDIEPSNKELEKYVDTTKRDLQKSYIRYFSPLIALVSVLISFILGRWQELFSSKEYLIDPDLNSVVLTNEPDLTLMVFVFLVFVVSSYILLIYVSEYLKKKK